MAETAERFAISLKINDFGLPIAKTKPFEEVY